ncbi:hypothetical protein M9Y10_030782 [Tritrichomonas musculus]|uniref:Ankyrin n=1 Tax=Tritrichomonas musculus TaxID=1915356 RepID=A0ABR2H4R6_9EUKA
MLHTGLPPSILAFTRAKDVIKRNPKKKTKSLNLINQTIDLCKYLPRDFTITTNNGSYTFNVEILKDTSPVIWKHLRENPNIFQYHIDINDDENIMGKFEQLLLGQKVIFNESELPIAFNITQLLGILKIQKYLNKCCLYNSNPYGSINNSIIQLTKSSFKEFLKKKIHKSFVITTNNKKYACNKFGVYSSKVIRDFIQSNPEATQYTYDFENEFDEFQLISNFFNAEPIQITSNNMNSLKKISEDLKIEFIIDDVTKFIDTYENSVQTIDEKQIIIDEINEIFHQLYHINEISVESVKDSIIESSFSYGEENVQELAAFILHVIHTKYFLHSYLIDLLITLNEAADEENDLNILLPFLVKQLMIQIGKNKLNCSFIYLLHKKGIISKEEIVNKIILVDVFLKNSNEQPEVSDTFNHQHHSNIVCWFFPELIKLKQIETSQLMNFLQPKTRTFISKFLPDKIEEFEKMRDSGEPNDLITKAILHDDVDLLQLVISKNNIDISNNKNRIPFNIFESFITDSNYLNYSAAYGSIKCFKYLLLNHAELTSSSLGFAILGGNTEIIVTVDQNSKKQKNQKHKKKKKFNYEEDEDEEIFAPIHARFNNYDVGYPHNHIGNVYNDVEIDEDEGSDDNNFNNKKKNDKNENYQNNLAAYYAIMQHQNDLFDWVMEKKFMSKGITGNSLSRIAMMSAKNGNIHSLIHCIDNGLDLNSLSRDFCEKLIKASSENGFLKLTEFILSLLKSKIDLISSSQTELPLIRQLDSSVSFGNISIFKLFLQMRSKVFDLERPLIIAVKRDYINICKLIIETTFEEKIQLSRDCMITILAQSIQSNSSEIFQYLIDKFKLDFIMKKFSVSSYDFSNFLLNGCESGNFNAVKLITSVILEKKLDVSFTDPFIAAASSESFEICEYFVKNKVFLNFMKLSKSASKLVAGNEQIFNLLIDIVDPEVKETFMKNLLSESIKQQKITYIERLLKENTPYDKALFEAVKFKNVDIVNIILKHDSSPPYINQISPNGTALNIAASSNNLAIVQRLLSLPGINASLYGKGCSTPLISSIRNYYIEVMNAILDFYGDGIQSQMWQIDEAFKYIFQKFSSNGEYRNPIGTCIYGCSSNKSSEKNLNKDEKLKILDVINRLIQIKNIDLNHPINTDTFLTYACKINEIDLIKILLKSDNIDVNLYDTESGNTPLMIAIENKNSEIAQFLIEFPQTNINLKNYANNTALTLAVNKEMKEIVSLLLNNERFNPTESCINYAFFISNVEIALQLISVKELDVNARFDAMKANHWSSSQWKQEIEPTTSLLHSIPNNNTQKVDIIINHPTFDPIKSQLKMALFKSIDQNKGEIFKKLLKLVNNDVNIYNQNGDSLFLYAVVNGCHEIVSRIVDNPTFDAKKSNLYKAFMISSFIEDNENDRTERALVGIMEVICQYDKEHDHLIDFNNLLPNGKSFYTSINRQIKNIGELATFFLKNGVDPNMPDERGIYPLEYAIGISSLEFVQVLILSGKIDFTIRLKNNIFSMSQNNQTYLHLAARCNDKNILNEIIKLNIIDVNSTDDLGETPLMEACKYNRLKNVHLLFQIKELNYLYHNNLGEDAIKIVQKFSNNFNYCGANRYRRMNGRESYLSELSSIISDNISELCNNLHDNLYQNEEYHDYDDSD